MNRTAKLLVAPAIAAALVISLAACQHSRQGHSAAAATTMKQSAAPQAAPPSAVPEQLAATPQIVVPAPRSAKSWVALGNKYFDSRQREKAIEAYAKALELEPDNPDVLTDQGVMYRELSAFDKAIANFKKASSIDPEHLPSLFNLGVLYAQDLKDYDKAIKTWHRLIAIAPTTVQAAKAQAYIDRVKQIPKPQ